MGAYDVESGKYTKLKKAFVVEGGKYVKLPKAFVVEGGKYVKLWSGSPQAFLITTRHGAMFSTDLVTWETIDFLSTSYSNYVNVAYGNGTYVIAYESYNGEGGWVASSSDGKTWTMQKLQDYNSANVLGFCNGKFVISICHQASSPVKGYTYTSEDGFNWTYVGDITFAGNPFGSNWNKRQPVYGNFNGSPRYVIGTGNYAWCYSTDLKTWTAYTDSANADTIAQFFALKDGTIYTATGNYDAPKLRNLSADGHPVVTSTANPSTYGASMYGLCYNNDKDEIAILTGEYTTTTQMARNLHVTTNRSSLSYKGKFSGYAIPMHNYGMAYGGGKYAVISINHNYSPASVSVFYTTNNGVSWTEKVIGTSSTIDSNSKIFFGY